MLSDEWLPRYRLLENFNIKWNGNRNGNGNGNAYDRGDYNSSFALRAVELKITIRAELYIFCKFDCTILRNIALNIYNAHVKDYTSTVSIG